MVKWMKEKIKRINEKIHLRRKIKRMDSLWNLYGGSCFGLFPPSFYYRHSEEEAQRLQQEEIAKLKEKLDEFTMRNETQA